MKTINLKETGASKEDCVILMEVFLQEAKNEGEVAVKLLHGYGSHGKGGAIYLAVREKLSFLKRHKKITDFFGGEKWNLLDKDTIGTLLKDKNCLDEDLNKSNPGITIVIL